MGGPPFFCAELATTESAPSLLSLQGWGPRDTPGPAIPAFLVSSVSSVVKILSFILWTDKFRWGRAERWLRCKEAPKGLGSFVYTRLRATQLWTVTRRERQKC